MTVEPKSERFESLASLELRSKYRCSMCHKHCAVPCRFTGAEFRALEQAMGDGVAPDDD